MSKMIEEVEWDVYYRREWVGSVFAIDGRDAKKEARFQFEHEDWDWNYVSLYRAKEGA